MAEQKQRPANRRQVPMDAKAEAAMLWSVWANNNQAMLDRLEVKDFADPLNQCIFEEFRNMSDCGVPLGDSVVVARWFSGAVCKERIEKRLRIDRSAAEVVADKLLEFKSEYTTSAHDEYYYRLLRIERLRRGMHQVGLLMHSRIESERDEPWKTIAWLQTNVDALWSLCHEIFEKEMDN